MEHLNHAIGFCLAFLVCAVGIIYLLWDLDEADRQAELARKQELGRILQLGDRGRPRW